MAAYFSIGSNINRILINKRKGDRVLTTKVETFNNYINGEWRESVSKKTFNSINPANTEDIVGDFPIFK